MNAGAARTVDPSYLSATHVIDCLRAAGGCLSFSVLRTKLADARQGRRDDDIARDLILSMVQSGRLQITADRSVRLR